MCIDLLPSSNTQERKPVTNSRDTQELLPDAGQEMLRIFHSHPARTSLLQDFAFYEVRVISFKAPLFSVLNHELVASHAEDTKPTAGTDLTFPVSRFCGTLPSAPC